MKIQMYSVKMCGLLRIPAVTSEIQEFSCSYGELKIVYFLCSTCQEAYKLCKYLNNFYIRLRGPGAPSNSTKTWCQQGPLAPSWCQRPLLAPSWCQRPLLAPSWCQRPLLAPSFGTVVWCSRTTILLELLLLHGSFVTGMVFILTRKL
jgi:hypothetical protein